MKSAKVAEAANPSSEQSASERRIAKRHACDGFAEVVVPSTGFLFRGEIANLSEFGCYVKTRARLSIRRSAEVELRFTVLGDNFSVLARAAAVQSGHGAGFEFSSIDPPMHKRLLELIEVLSSRDNVG